MTTDALPTVSAVVPTHGRVDFLDRALTSIAAQSHPVAEVIVVDDLGDAATQQLVSARATSYPVPLRYRHNADQPGACGSRNAGAAASTGATIAFLDDDDEWNARFVERCLSALAQSGADFVLADIERTFPDGTIKYLTTTPGLTRANVLHQRVHMTGSSFIIRRPAFDSVGGFDRDVPVFNDWDLFLRLVRSGKTYACVTEPLVRWIEHDGARITTATLRRADGIDRFLGVYGADMSPEVKGYFVRIAYGIRKAHEKSAVRRALLTARMFAAAGIAGTLSILRQNVVERTA